MGIVYHVIREDRPQYEVDQIITSPFEKNRDLSKWKQYKQTAEQMLEEKRLECFPDKPSRLSSLFVAGTLEDIEKWVKDKYPLGALYYLYEMEVIDGTIAYFDTDWFEGLAELLSDGQIYISHKHSIETCIDNFWRGIPFKSSGYSLKEGLVIGKVKVISKFRYLYNKQQGRIIKLT